MANWASLSLVITARYWQFARPHRRVRPRLFYRGLEVIMGDTVKPEVRTMDTQGQ